MNFLADENVDFPIVEQLRAAGHTVRYVLEMEPGISDTEVLAPANGQAAILLTADKDFGEIVFRQKQIMQGVVLFRLGGIAPAEKAHFLENVIARHADELPGAFTVITSSQIRIRRME